MIWFSIFWISITFTFKIKYLFNINIVRTNIKKYKRLPCHEFIRSNFLNIKSEKNKEFIPCLVDHYIEIARLVKEARIQQNLTIQELSCISKIPERIINSIENNDKNIRPKYPFIRSILIKLEECLALQKNTLVKLAIKERKLVKKEKKDFIVSKFDLINLLMFFNRLELVIYFSKIEK